MYENEDLKFDSININVCYSPECRSFIGEALFTGGEYDGMELGFTIDRGYGCSEVGEFSVPSSFEDFLYNYSDVEYIKNVIDSNIDDVVEGLIEEIYRPVEDLIGASCYYEFNYDEAMININIDNTVYLDAPLVFNDNGKVDIEYIIDCVRTATDEQNLTDRQLLVLNDFKSAVEENYREIFLDSLDDKLSAADNKALKQEVPDIVNRNKYELEV